MIEILALNGLNGLVFCHMKAFFKIDISSDSNQRNIHEIQVFILQDLT